MDNTVGSQQQNIICGTLLGDGFLERNGKFVRLVIDHSAKQEAYVRWKAERLTTLVPSIIFKERIDTRTHQIYSHCILRTRVSPSLERYVALFYQGKRKRVPVMLPKMINPQMLAIWIMDDGYKRNDCNAMRLNTQSYSFAEHCVIKKAFKRLNIETHIQKHKKHFVIYIPSQPMSRLRAIARPFVIPAMEYKLA